MTLQTILSGIYGALNTYIIPFLVTVAFIAFVVNVVRYFILQSDSDAGKESARKYLLWSLIGFVLITALWGIINLVMGIFGFNTFGGIVCPDYDKSCNSSGIQVTTNTNTFGGGPITPFTPSVWFPNTTNPNVNKIPPTQPNTPHPYGPDGVFIPPGTTLGDYSNVGKAAQDRVEATLGIDKTFVSNQLSQISMDVVPDESRFKVVLAAANAGVITQPELSQAVVDINIIRKNMGDSPISLSSITTSEKYTQDLGTAYRNLPGVTEHIKNYYLSNGLPDLTAEERALVDTQSIFRTNNTFSTRVNNAASIMEKVMENDPGHPAFDPLLKALNAEAGYEGCGDKITVENLFQNPCG